MGFLTTHVLDLVTGTPAAGMALRVSKVDGDSLERLVEALTNSDGRVDRRLLDGPDFTPGVYQIDFHVGDYFAPTRSGGAPFLDIVPLRFGVGDASLHYHVPLLVTPWSYSTYRGS